MQLSVIIPTFNRHHLLKQAIQSVFAQQDLQEFEILVVDDGSTDDTSEIVREYPEHVHYFRQEHSGLSAARNLALQHASGEFIALLDDDDLWLPFKSNLQIKMLQALKEAAFIYSDFFICKESGKKIPAGLKTWFPGGMRWNTIFSRISKIKDIIPNIEFGHQDVYIGNLYEPLLKDPHVLPSTAIIRRDVIENGLQFPEKDDHCGDWDFFTRLSKKYDAVFLPFETAINRSHSDPVRLTKKSKSRQLACRVDLIERIWESDQEFYQKNNSTVKKVKNEQLLNLAKFQLLENKTKPAIETLKRITYPEVRHRKEYFMIKILAFIPFGGILLKLALNLKNIFIK